MPTVSPRTEEFSWGRMEWLADHASHPGVRASLARMVIKAKEASPRHRHDNCAEILHVLDGAVTVHIDGNGPLPLLSGGTTVVPAYKSHWVSNAGPTQAVIMIAYSSGTGDYIEVDAA